MTSALKLFSEHGYHGTSTSMIATKAGISKGLLYHYIDSKEDLIKKIVSLTAADIYEPLSHNENMILTPAEFELFVRQSFEIIKKHKTFYILFYSLVLTPEVRKIIDNELLQGGMNHYLDLLKNYFAEHFEKPEKEFVIYSTMHEGASIMYCMDGENLLPGLLDIMIEEIIERFARVN